MFINLPNTQSINCINGLIQCKSNIIKLIKKKVTNGGLDLGS